MGDKIVIAGQEGAIVTHIRGLLIPESNQEIRVTVNHRIAFIYSPISLMLI